MTRADIETMLNELAATTRYLQDSSRLMREASEQIVAASEHLITVSDHLKEIGDRTSAAITAGLQALHDEGES